MRNIFQNKKVLISIIVAVVVIVVAIVLFVVLNKTGDNKKSDGDSTIKFSEGENNEGSNNKELDNKTSNNTSSGADVGSNVDDFYINAAEQFVKAFMDTDEMEDFLENYADIKAFAAYENVKGDETKFMDEYVSLSDDDPKIEECRQACLALPESYNMAINFMDMAANMAEQAEELNNQSNTTTENTIDYDNFTDEDKLLVIKEIGDPEKSQDDEHISKIKVTCSWMQEDADLYIVFYDNIVIFICDENGTPITKSGAGAGTDFSELDEEN